MGEEEAAWAAEEEAAWAEQESTSETVVAKSATTVPVPPTVSRVEPAAPAPKPQPKRKPPVEIESKWGVPTVPAESVAEEAGDMPTLAESLPSLADALTAPKQKFV